MSDLISRCELFNKLATIPAPPEANDFKAEVYKVIQQMKTVDGSGKWTPCSERLPELTIHENEPFIGEWDDSEPVLIYHRDNKYQYPYLIAQCTNGFENGEVGWTEMEEANEVINVLAWMPLPKPYKERSK